VIARGQTAVARRDGLRDGGLQRRNRAKRPDGGFAHMLASMPQSRHGLHRQLLQRAGTGRRQKPAGCVHACSDRLRFCMCGLLLCGSSAGQSRRKNGAPHPGREPRGYLHAGGEQRGHLAGCMYAQPPLYCLSTRPTSPPYPAPQLLSPPIPPPSPDPLACDLQLASAAVSAARRDSASSRAPW
jgi:hypothetical protein